MILVLKPGKYRDKVINILAVMYMFHFVQLSTQSFISNNPSKDPSFQNYTANRMEKLLINFQHIFEFIFINIYEGLRSFVMVDFSDQ